ncbi:fumarylacetoacetate hydrolase family protein [Terrimonas rubra]|uniref:Fumarylacetoacetate hydrolase family protein n=1 Tax=Terrimonas rubra TaxID=1035890 RepID=A0ABW5ZZ46_9BACT
MKLYKTKTGIIVGHEDRYYLLPGTDWDTLINQPALYNWLQETIAALQPYADTFTSDDCLVPIGSQEVWAAGVTYLRSKVARMEESKESGGATFYDKVYDAERPEIFFKANPYKVVPHQGKVRIRKDSNWNVPEPELTLVINSNGEIVGYTIGNDMSSRSIEGENPLYLPQAKMYDGSAAVGPCVLVTAAPIDPATLISICIMREGVTVFEGNVTIDKMKRKHTELVEFLYREYSFSTGAYLMTGTCVVPDNDFTLQPGDAIQITITGIGTLINTVA